MNAKPVWFWSSKTRVGAWVMSNPGSATMIRSLGYVAVEQFNEPDWIPTKTELMDARLAVAM